MYVNFSALLPKLSGRETFDVRTELLRSEQAVSISRMVVASAGPSRSRRVQVFLIMAQWCLRSSRWVVTDW